MSVGAPRQGKRFAAGMRVLNLPSPAQPATRPVCGGGGVKDARITLWKSLSWIRLDWPECRSDSISLLSVAMPLVGSRWFILVYFVSCLFLGVRGPTPGPRGPLQPTLLVTPARR